MPRNILKIISRSLTSTFRFKFSYALRRKWYFNVSIYLKYDVINPN
jgi:hypothetical protein